MPSRTGKAQAVGVAHEFLPLVVRAGGGVRAGPCRSGTPAGRAVGCPSETPVQFGVRACRRGAADAATRPRRRGRARSLAWRPTRGCRAVASGRSLTASFSVTTTSARARGPRQRGEGVVVGQRQFGDRAGRLAQHAEEALRAGHAGRSEQRAAQRRVQSQVRRFAAPPGGQCVDAGAGRGCAT